MKEKEKEEALRFFVTIEGGKYLRRVLEAMVELPPKEELRFEYGGRWFNVTTNDKLTKRSGVKQRRRKNLVATDGGEALRRLCLKELPNVVDRITENLTGIVSLLAQKGGQR